jgi:hypothetical protein
MINMIFLRFITYAFNNINAYEFVVQHRTGRVSGGTRAASHRPGTDELERYHVRGVRVSQVHGKFGKG